MTVDREIQDESERIKAEYRRRQQEIPADYYSLTKPAILFAYQQRTRKVLEALKKAGMFPLENKRILEIGCGTGDWLIDFASWGAKRGNLAGIEINEERRNKALERIGKCLNGEGGDILLGDASTLPWHAEMFDIVLQSTVFTSILQDEMKRAVASEMARVLKSEGIILWYDFFYDNPKNPNVKGVKSEEIHRLFPNFHIKLERITLAPPLGRRIVPISWTGAMILEKFKVLNTHYLGVFTRLKK